MNSPEWVLKNNASLIPFEWTKDKARGFKSFMECYELWEERAKLDDAIDVDYVFF